jgi:hypothetical protein
VGPQPRRRVGGDRPPRRRRRARRRLHLQVPQRRTGAPAYLYVREDLQQRLRSPIQGWFGQRDQFAMGPPTTRSTASSASWPVRR